MAAEWQRTLRTGLLVFEAAAVVGLVLLQAAGVHLPVRGIFAVVVALALAPTLYWWAWMDQHLGRAARTARLRLSLRILAGFDCMPGACEALAQLHGRCGRFVVIGNHDLIDSPGQALDYMRTHEPGFLSDECRQIDIGGEPLRIAGLAWPRYERTLAGHTHGGQIMLTPPGAAHPFGGGNLLFRYIWGEYRQGRSAMYVSSGVGNWFPLRVNAPAEIVQIQLS